MSAPAFMEPSLGYHSWDIGVLTCDHESGRGTLSGGQGENPEVSERTVAKELGKMTP